MNKKLLTRKEVARATSKMIEEAVPSIKKQKSDDRFKWVITSSCFAGAVIAALAIYCGAVKGPEYNFIEDDNSSVERTTGMRNYQSFNDYDRLAQEPIIEETPEQTESAAEVERTLDKGETSEAIERVWYAPDWYDSTRMSYMDFRTITCEGTDQWNLQHDGWTSTDPVTGIRMRGGRYMIALGQTFGLTGTKVNVYLENGAFIPCILGDSKEWCDTLDGEGVIGADSGTVEFIVEEEYLPDNVVELGSNELQYNGYWQSPVEYIEVLTD